MFQSPIGLQTFRSREPVKDRALGLYFEPLLRKEISTGNVTSTLVSPTVIQSSNLLLSLRHGGFKNQRHTSLTLQQDTPVPDGNDW